MKNNVRDVRLQKEWSQTTLAEKTAVSRQSIHAIETGKYIPTTVLALKLARALEVPVEVLFQLEERD